jgi:peptidoglycan/xylan/chitin deacetylase (PgdA/CDA1 family)
MSQPKKAALMVLHEGGGLAAVRFLTRRRLRILTYHRFAPPGRNFAAEWEQQCRHLARHYRLVTLTDVRQAFEGGVPLPPYALAVTVDDGYRDFYQVAFPIARKYGVPVTVFLATSFLDRKQWLWWDRIYFAFAQAPQRPVEITLAGQAWQLTPPGGALPLLEFLATMAEPDRFRAVEDVAAALGVSLPATPPPEYEALEWDEVRDMARQGMDFGSHTCTHPILPQVDDSRLREEIVGSKQRVEEELGRPVQWFCYPNGDWRDERGRILQEVASAGYRLAVTTIPGTNATTDLPLQLKRIGVDASLNQRYFERCAAAIRL